MNQYRHSPFDEELVDAMMTYNLNNPAADKFTLIDARILSLVHSYNYSDMFFFASNQYLADRCFSTPATIQKSINKLCALNLITKKVFCSNGRKQRILSYNEDGVQQFKCMTII